MCGGELTDSESPSITCIPPPQSVSALRTTPVASVRVNPSAHCTQWGILRATVEELFLQVLNRPEERHPLLQPLLTVPCFPLRYPGWASLSLSIGPGYTLPFDLAAEKPTPILLLQEGSGIIQSLLLI